MKILFIKAQFVFLFVLILLIIQKRIHRKLQVVECDETKSSCILVLKKINFTVNIVLKY